MLKTVVEQFAKTNGDFNLVQTRFADDSAVQSLLNLAEQWLAVTAAHQTLCFVVFEPVPISKQALTAPAEQEVASHSLIQKTLLKALIETYPFLLPGQHLLTLVPGRVKVSLWVGDLLPNLPFLDAPVHFWHLNLAESSDYYSPTLFNQMARLGVAGTQYICNLGQDELQQEIQQGLSKSGFSVNKQLTTLAGHYQHLRAFSSKKPWYASPLAIEQSNDSTACVIGAGLAGAAAAFKLAEAGWQVTVLEAEPSAATQASGNLAGAIHPLVTADWNIRSQFYHAGYETTLAWLSGWLKAGEIVGNLDGLMQLTMDDKMQHRLTSAIERVGLPKDFGYWCSAVQASQKIGIKTQFEGMFFPKAGWVNPKSIVERCLQHPNIKVVYQQTVESIQQVDGTGSWQVVSQNTQYESQILVVASGGLSQALNKKLNLPVRPTKGQVTQIETAENPSIQTLKTTVTHQGYSVSGINLQGKNYHVSGATFEAPDLSPMASTASYQANFDMASRALPGWLPSAECDVPGYSAKVGFRPTTPDHLPLIGAVVDADFANKHYYIQSHTHSAFRYPAQQYQRGLFVSNGHGARGLMSVFLAADVILEQVQGRATNYSLSWLQAVHPERFKVRNWRNAKTF